MFSAVSVIAPGVAPVARSLTLAPTLMVCALNVIFPAVHRGFDVSIVTPGSIVIVSLPQFDSV